ncbi:hypothetical protein AGABI1DRAFT_116505 [Agaricus bisporus var. burnettii JB137-S8]|nr:hypothetical protein AGABI2DRAFT_195525 [Agaricus bisporus var. bisporus H97]XP_007334151.1 uncharacterized protein AGABI1DRAFT_116505 [Agaricus bisporus var. burnettii JB137-S8]EKM75211.1 hypothetical protein AGABI1DRAFT_116505 [Agaricus bisporus var. burnettii JB137-S8]EKV42698.1 hypothetical protein AGABI2DRAFT_195525 [Agaricus bisporus var. bisporus H97]
MRDIEPMDVVFQHDPVIPSEIAWQFEQLNIKSLPSQGRDLPWRRFMTDDSDDLVDAILDERWDVAGASIQ